MDPAEIIYKRLAKLWGRLWGAGQGGAAMPPGAVALETCRERLETLAALLAGEVLELHGADDGVGGVTGTVLLLPRRMALAPDAAEDNGRAYLVRLAWSCVVREMGLSLHPSARDGFDATLVTLLAVPLVRARMAEAYPAGAAQEASLARRLLDGRPAPAWSTAGGVLEAWTQRCMGGEAAWERRDVPAAVREFLDATCAVRVGSREDLHTEAQHLRAQLEACVGGRWGQPPPGVPLWGRILAPPPASTQAAGAPVETRGADGSGERNVIDLERTIRLRRQVHRRREDKPLYHLFEKVETAEEHRGEGGTPDAEGDVREMEDALKALSLGTVIRTTDDPRNLVRAEVLMDEPLGVDVAGEAPSHAVRTFHYPEWDFKKQRYQEDHCTVREERWRVEGATGEAQAAMRDTLRAQRRQVEALRAHLLRSLYRRRMRDRQLEGPDIDVEAIVERHADLAAGRTPPERLYLAARKALREVAILVLVDTSFSTDAWLDGRRVLDVEMQSLLILAEAFAGHLEDEVAVASFRSHTRHDVRFGVLKGFEDRWGALHRAVPALVPGGYTRIGAAMRHASALLEATGARRRMLLLLSDGKPTDYDRYEGRYGVEDVRQAVREAGQRRVHVFGLAVEKEAKRHLARMLGPGSYRILPQPSRLPDAMADVFVGMLTG
jgi:hypothetical protein